MSVLPRTAVVVVHGIGEQRPLDTLRNFVGLRSTKRGRGILGRADEGETNDPLRADREHVFVGPDTITRSTYSRRLSFDQTHLVSSISDLPKGLKRANYGQATHFYEYYWAYRFRDTAWRHLAPLLIRLIKMKRANTYEGAFRGSSGLRRRLTYAALIAVFILFASLIAYTIFCARELSGSQGQVAIWRNCTWLVPLFFLFICGFAIILIAQFLGLSTFVRWTAIVSLCLGSTVLVALWQADTLARSAEQTSTSRFSGILVSLIVSAIIPVLSGFPLKQLGDAARYMSNHPDNVTERETIRNGLITMLRELESRRDPVTKRALYDRIVLVGHSLGSVIAYDALTAYWIESNQRFYFPDRGNESEEEPLGLLIKQLEDQTSKPFDTKAWISQQRRLQTALSSGVRWRKGAFWKSPQRWIVTDLVTVGSPLCHAEVLLATGKTDWEDLKETRLVASSPPEAQHTEQANELHRFRYRAWRGGYYVTKLHHQALFAITSWTNIHFTNDLVGGPISLRFGEGVQDISIPTGASTLFEARRFSHTSYWGATSRLFNNEEAANRSRKELRNIILRNLPVLVMSGTKAQLCDFRDAVISSDIPLQDHTVHTEDCSSSSQLIRMRFLRVSAKHQPPRQWAWLGIDPLLSVNDLGEIFNLATAAGLTSRFSDNYRPDLTYDTNKKKDCSGRRSAKSSSFGSDDSETIDVPLISLDPDSVEPNENMEFIAPYKTVDPH